MSQNNGNILRKTLIRALVTKFLLIEHNPPFGVKLTSLEAVINETLARAIFKLKLLSDLMNINGRG